MSKNNPEIKGYCDPSFETVKIHLLIILFIAMSSVLAYVFLKMVKKL